MKQKLERNIAMTFRVTEQERDLIREAQKESGIINMRAYLLKMAVNGLNIRIDLDSIRNMNRLLNNYSSLRSYIIDHSDIITTVNQLDSIECIWHRRLPR